MSMNGNNAAMNDVTEDSRMCDKSIETIELNYPIDIASKEKIYGESYFKGDDSKVNFNTGLPSFDTVKAIFDFVKKPTGSSKSALSPFQEFVAVLMKVRINVPLQYRAYRFRVSLSTISRIFSV